MLKKLVTIIDIFLNLILVCIFLAALYIFYRHGMEIKLRRLEIALLCWTFILGAAFIASVKLRAPWYSDSYYVTYAAQRAAVGDYSAMENYFVRFPFQLGYVLYSEIFFRAAGLLIPGLPEGYYCLALQGVNLLWLVPITSDEFAALREIGIAELLKKCPDPQHLHIFDGKPKFSL